MVESDKKKSDKKKKKSLQQKQKRFNDFGSLKNLFMTLQEPYKVPSLVSFLTQVEPYDIKVTPYWVVLWYLEKH